MSSLRNSIRRKVHNERAQPDDRKKFGLLEKHKDYVIRARAYHKKEEMLHKLKEKAASRNPDEFYFKMINSRVVDGVHRSVNEANKYSQEELMLMKSQDIGYVHRKILHEKKEIEKLSSMLHYLDSKPPNKHVYFAEDRDEEKEIRSRLSRREKSPTFEHLPESIKRKTISSYKQLEERKDRVKQLEKVHNNMIRKQTRKRGPKRKLHGDEMVSASTKPAKKCWRYERKR